MNEISNIRRIRPIETFDYAEAVGSVSAQIRWAMAAIKAGEPANAWEFLRRAQQELLPVHPNMQLGPTDLYTPGVTFDRRHGPEAF